MGLKRAWGKGKKKARIEIQARLNPIFYEKPLTRCEILFKSCILD